MELEHRRYIDDRLYGKYEVRPWVYSEWVYEGKCDRCKDKTEVFYIYSHMDGKYLNLCDFDLQQYVMFGFIAINKDGRVPNRDPHAPRELKPKNPKFWNIKTYCKTCECVVTAYGISYPREGMDFLFIGECESCTSKIEGDLGYLYSLKDSPAPLQSEMKIVPSLNFEEYKNSLLGTKTKPTKSEKLVKIPEYRLRLFCSPCDGERSFYGLPMLGEDDLEVFTGNCGICSYVITGEVEELIEHSKLLLKKRDLNVEKMATDKNAEFAKSYADEFFTNLRKKLRKPT